MSGRKEKKKVEICSKMSWYELKLTSVPDIRHAEEGFDSQALVNHGLNDSEEGCVLLYQSG